jgi:hypothetical protein
VERLQPSLRSRCFQDPGRLGGVGQFVMSVNLEGFVDLRSAFVSLN